MWRLLLVTVLAACTLAPAAHAEVVWLCHPDLAAADDPCQTPQDTTVQAADGSSTVEDPVVPPAARRPVDCFYVYPTVSNQLGANATQAKDPEVRAVAKFQASRYARGCRMFAPVYRQATVAGVLGNVLPGPASVAFSDVREAWEAYLASDNGGRGVILLGHSQGTIMLRNLIRTEIDPDPAARDKLVGAAILGGNVTTRAGAATGGDFAHVPVCTRRGEDGCVVAYSTWSTDPGPTPFFGNTNTDALGTAFGLPSGAGFEVACTDPGVLSGRPGAVPLTIPTEPFPPGFIAGGIAATSGGEVPTAPTTWIQGFAYEGGCRTINGAHVFRYDPVGDSRRLNEFPPAWGTHLVDFNLAVDELLTIARLQTRTWLADHLRLRAGLRRVRVAVPAAGVLTVRGRGVRSRRLRADGPARLTLKVRPRAGGRRATRLSVRLRSAGVPGVRRAVRVRLR